MLIPKQNELFNSMNIIIKKDRDKEAVDRTLIKQMKKILEDLDRIVESNNTNLDQWYSTLVIATKDYIAEKSKIEMSTYSTVGYIRSSLNYLKEEKERFIDYSMTDFIKVINEINCVHYAKKLCEVSIYIYNNYIDG